MPSLAKVLALPVMFLVLLVQGPAQVLIAEDTFYEIRLTGVEGTGLTEIIEETSNLYRLQDDPPPSPVGLRRRADADQDRIRAALFSEGYYDATITMAVDTEQSPALVTVAIETGDRYRFADISIDVTDERDADAIVGLIDELGLESGAVARGPVVVRAEQRLLSALRSRGYAYAEMVDRGTFIDRSTREMDVEFLVDPRGLTRFGEVTVSGLEDVRERVVLRRVPWQRGDTYDPEEIERARSNLANLEVFETVRVDVDDDPESRDADGRAPVAITVTERPRRFIGAGASYSTSEGFGVNAFWGHRNLFGGAERLRLSLDVNRLGENKLEDTNARLGATFSRPDFLGVRQSFLGAATIDRDITDAYRRLSASASGVVERELTDNLTVSGGVGVEQIQITDDRRRRDEGLGDFNATLVSFPFTARYDTTDDALDPTEGYRVRASSTPTLSAAGDGAPFWINRITASTYLAPFGSDGTVFAVRGSIGSIYGADTADIPADKRFFAGGGGSIRGYGFQRVGPKNDRDQPIGGRSIVELGLETRLRVTDTIGIVPFVDAGTVSDTSLPDFGDSLKIGAGIGVRYFTDFGPLRLDVAVPVNRADGDRGFEVYISLGQAF